MYVERVNDESEQRKQEHEANWDRTRVLWSVLMNANFKKQGGGKFTPEDLIKLSFDKVLDQQKPDLEMFEKLVKKHGKRKKKNVK